MSCLIAFFCTYCFKAIICAFYVGSFPICEQCSNTQDMLKKISRKKNPVARREIVRQYHRAHLKAQKAERGLVHFYSFSHQLHATQQTLMISEGYMQGQQWMWNRNRCQFKSQRTSCLFIVGIIPKFIKTLRMGTRVPRTNSGACSVVFVVVVVVAVVVVVVVFVILLFCFCFCCFILSVRFAVIAEHVASRLTALLPRVSISITPMKLWRAEPM